jgi:hypothetical protein
VKLNDWDIRDKFIREIGSFTINFSKLEIGISELAAYTIDDLRYWEIKYNETYGLSLKNNRDLIKKFIQKEIPKLLPTWELINIEIGVLNHSRRHLIHGSGRSYLLHEPIITTIKNNGEFEKREFSVSDIKKLNSKIAHLCTGENGICGHFSTLFKTTAFNWHNENSQNHHKIIYKVNNETQTDWKG